MIKNGLVLSRKGVKIYKENQVTHRSNDLNLIDEKRNREKNSEFLKDQQILLKGTLLLLLRIMQKLIQMIFKMELIKLSTHNAKSNVLLRNYNTTLSSS